ncbi:MAG TPA: tetratricopeptide repeat protein [Candidatus Saccharimonadales bacterium]|nr:tetratricopeptide repeat protein [Candidatus Saccharimonadales bacterium]
MNKTGTEQKDSAAQKGIHRKAWKWASAHRKLSLIILVVLAAAIGIGIWLFARSDESTKEISNNPIIASYQKQLPALADAVKKDGNDPKARQEYAVALYATGDVGQAKEQYEAQLKLASNDATLRNNLGNVYRDLGDYEKAIDSYQKSIDINKKQTNAYINLANLYLYTLDKKDLAVQVYRDALRNNPDNQDLMVLLGIAYEQSGDKNKARDTFRDVLDKNASNAAAQAGLKRVQ